MNYNDRAENEALKASIASLAQIPERIREMDTSQLDAELDRYRTQSARRTPRHREADLVQAHSEVLAAVTRGTRASHPLAEELLANGKQPTLLAMARNWASNVHGPDAHYWDDHKILAYASTSHLSEVIGQNANSIVLTRAPELMRIPIRLSRAVSLPDYKPMSVGAITLDAGVPEPRLALDEWANIVPLATATQLQAGLAPLRIRFSEILLTNDDLESMARTIEAALLAASQNEARMFVRLLTTNANLPDGSPWFGDSNSVLGETASAVTLAAAMGKMRSATVNGWPGDLRPRFWLVPAADEFAAREAVKAVSVNEPVVEVVPTAHLAAGVGGFMFCDPAAWPAVARGTLRGSNGVSLRFAPGNPTEAESHRDAIVEGLHTVAFSPLSRQGIVRIAPAE